MDAKPIKTVSMYDCTKCGYTPPDWDGEHYKGSNGEKYPKFSNERKGATMDGSYHDWTETHFCPNCKEEFEFENGAF